MDYRPPTATEARAILSEEIAKFSSRIDPIMDTHEGPRNEARQLAWWLKDESDTESAMTDRNIAYLRAYRRIAGPRALWAVGLPLAKQRIYLDRSIMRRLYRDNYVTFEGGSEPFFKLTLAGEELIAE